jgi:hypothetical protein
VDEIKPHFIPNNGVKITKENAREYALRRWDKARELARQGLAEAAAKRLEEALANGTTISPVGMEDAGWKMIIEHAADVYFKTASARGMSDLGSFIGKATGNIQDANSIKQEPEEQKLPGEEDARYLLQIFNFYEKEYKRPDVIDGEVHETTDPG